jgi:hypothetical protein
MSTKSFVSLISLLFFSIPIIACQSPPFPQETDAPASTPTLQGDNPAQPATQATIPIDPTMAPDEAPTILGLDPASLDGITIEFWHIWGGNYGDTIQDIVDRFNLLNKYNIIVETNNLESYGELLWRCGG